MNKQKQISITSEGPSNINKHTENPSKTITWSEFDEKVYDNIAMIFIFFPSISWFQVCAFGTVAVLRKGLTEFH